ncbi:MAG: peptide-methionine (S)-S-oxide reductase MsrA [Christensenellales bacterium]
MKKVFAALLALLVGSGAPAPTMAQEGTDMKTIYFAGGCFWGIEKLMSLVPGVQDAVSGYANGSKENPSYREVSAGDTGHRETVKVSYDANRVALKDLLKLYFSVIDPTIRNRQGNDVGSQYQTGIYWVDEADKAIVEAYAAGEKAKYAAFQVELAKLSAFYLAEDYHQDYLDKNPGGYCHIPLTAFDEARNLVPQVARKAEYRKITAKQAQEMMASGQKLTILDVRTPAEFQGGHIKDAVNLPLDEIAALALKQLPDKDAMLLVYCRSGARSRSASMQLVSLGYTGVYDFGGIIDWPGAVVK